MLLLNDFPSGSWTDSEDSDGSDDYDKFEKICNDCEKAGILYEFLNGCSDIVRIEFVAPSNISEENLHYICLGRAQQEWSNNCFNLEKDYHRFWTFKETDGKWVIQSK